MPRYEQFRLPDAGEGLTEAEIVEWRVAVGDPVTVNQVIVEIETAKSLVELPCPFDGVVSALLVDLGRDGRGGHADHHRRRRPDGPGRGRAGRRSGPTPLRCDLAGGAAGPCWSATA